MPSVDEVLLAFERRARATPEDADAQFRLGAALLRAGRPTDAARALRAALVAAPGHGAAARELARVPGLARGPWPSEDGDEDGGRRSAFPGARRGVLGPRVTLSSPPRGAPVVAADGRALVATLEGCFAIDASGRIEAIGPREAQRGPPVLAGGDSLVLLLGERGVAVLDAKRQLVWSNPELGGRAFEPMVADDLVIVGVENVGVSAFDLATGARRWLVLMDAESYSRPSLGGELAVVAVRGDRPSVVRGYGEAWRWQLHAIDHRRGHVRWSSEPRAERFTGAPEVPLVARETVFARVEADVLAFAATDGRLLGEANAHGPLALGGDGLVRVLQGERLVGLDERGSERWAGDPGQSYLNGRLAVDLEGTTFVATNERVAAIGKSGGFLWSCAVPRITSRPVIGNGCLLVTSYHERTVTWII